jgi:hypothetical protein
MRQHEWQSRLRESAQGSEQFGFVVLAGDDDGFCLGTIERDEPIVVRRYLDHRKGGIHLVTAASRIIPDQLMIAARRDAAGQPRGFRVDAK